ncbi:16S rRNA (uracil(1498)-N(3))-methyltransferase [Nocardioides sp. HDW12B]|uniref:16S rRNA (uracil(1498)-N(3))-methyltransferase n=1 Tax=Nocardioides sp. HDW12B TaxID=2714939 RepID=UPI00140B0FEE|nr:16S rRNA (uracil(1498)-N(3))-methyltransferase [Nocardioides sp. HDW12B]QIK65823.1 16S rRNA (uracil(1498)-N(3))-methyltransferase [Nocardioides sp. HDW12B]
MSLATFVHPDVGSAGVGEQVRLDGEEGHHAAVVRRVAAGEQVTLTDGAGHVARCRVVEAGKGWLDLSVLEVAAHQAEMPRLVVVQALPKGERGELAVEMLTEVGVDVIVPWSASRSIARWKGDRVEKSLAKWRSAAREAAKQSRRSWFPEVADLATTADVVALLASASVRVVLHEAASGPLADVPVPGRGQIVIVVGPEGGITDEELEAFSAVGAEPLRMGSSVLRSSTAGVAAAAALLARTPRWR